MTGYFVDSSQAIARRPAKSRETTGDFTYMIHRGFPDSTSGRLLGIAEATYPPRDLLVRIATEKGYEVGSDSAGVPLWWCHGVGESRVPYAITSGALEYYLRLTNLFRDRLFKEAGAQPLFWSDLSYRATIAKRDSFVVSGKKISDVYVAQLTLNWTYDDGTFMPSMRAHRTVVFAPGGEIVAVEGDGATEETVSISIHRGVGRQEKMLR